MGRTYLFMALCGILIAAFFLSMAPAQEASDVGGNRHPAWEYRSLALSEVVKLEQALQDPAGVNAALEARFNELGRDGWELAISLPGAVVFKQPKR